VLDFEGDPASGSLNVVEHAQPAAAVEDWLAYGAGLERQDPKAAMEAYRKAIAEAPDRLDARINLGRLLHEARRFLEAERVYREAVAACGRDALLLYNLGVLLGDMGRKREAAIAYEAALQEDPTTADAHYNLALLYQELGRAKQAIRHLSEYRRLTRT
jgi:tetratricopeptide (TPR) repeat protein